MSRAPPTYAVRLQMDPTALAARNIGIDQVASAVQHANVNIATGTLNGPTQATLIHVNGQLTTAAQWSHQIIAWRNGAPVRVAGCRPRHRQLPEQPAPPPGTTASAPSCSPIQRQPGSNTIQIVDSINQVIPRFVQTLPRSAHLTVVYDRSQSIRASVGDVQITLLHRRGAGGGGDLPVPAHACRPPSFRRWRCPSR